MTLWTPGYDDMTRIGIADVLLRFFGQRGPENSAASMTTDASSDYVRQDVPMELSQQGSETEEERGVSFAVDSTTTRRDTVALLEAAVQADDAYTFVEMVERIDWSRQSPADFVAAVHLALAVGAHLTARHLAMLGHRLHPDHQELDEMAYILAPPTVKPSSRPADPSGRLNFEWLEDHAADYRGQWIALRQGHFLASASTARELKEKLDDTKGIFVARVP